MTQQSSLGVASRSQSRLSPVWKGCVGASPREWGAFLSQELPGPAPCHRTTRLPPGALLAVSLRYTAGGFSFHDACSVAAPRAPTQLASVCFQPATRRAARQKPPPPIYVSISQAPTSATLTASSRFARCGPCVLTRALSTTYTPASSPAKELLARAPSELQGIAFVNLKCQGLQRLAREGSSGKLLD